MDATVLSVASNAVLDACERLGLDREALAEAAGLDLEQLAQPDARIPAAKADAIWTAAVAASADPCLAIHAAEALPVGAYRVIDFLVVNAPTLGEGLTRIAAYFPLVDPRGRIEIVEDEGGFALMFTTVDGRPLPRPAVEYTFAALVVRTRQGMGVEWRPRAVEFAGPPGAPIQEAEFERVLGVAASHGAAGNRLRIAAADWSRPNERSDQTLFEVLDRHAAMLLVQVPKPEPSLVEGMRAAVGAELRAGTNPVLERVARRLALSGRTLQRRLDEHGLRFGELVDEVKTEQAKAYLYDRQLALCEIGFLLGFADQSAFTRAFKRWTGITPGRFRRVLATS